MYRYGSFTRDAKLGELRKEARPVRLRLVLLVHRAGAIVTRAEIQHELWNGDPFVDDDPSIHFCVKGIREAPGGHADGPPFVETVPGRGYRFLAPALVLVENSGP